MQTRQTTVVTLEMTTLEASELAEYIEFTRQAALDQGVPPDDIGTAESALLVLKTRLREE